jgi:uncharacterized membrane protein
VGVYASFVGIRKGAVVELLTGLGLSIPAGLNAYIPLLVIAVAQRFEWLQLKEPFNALGEWWMIAIIAVLLVVEMIADKVPAVDSVNDAIQGFVRPAAGGVVAVAAAGSAVDISPWLLVLAGVLLAGGVHAVKATTRPAVNLTTAGVGTPAVSAAEDVGALVLSVMALIAPVLVVFVSAGVVYSLWRLWRRMRSTGSIIAEP